MSRRHKKPAVRSTTMAAAPAEAGSMQAFSFGEPVPMLDRREIMDYLQCTDAGKWYEPPIAWDGLARSLRANVHHASALAVKRNVLVSTFQPHPLLSRAAFASLVMDFLVFGNGYLEKRRHRLGGVLELKPALAKYVRRAKDLAGFWWVPGYDQEQALGEVFHLLEPDINQEVYGLPEYLAALQSAWLNESATLFRRKYYLNGSHAGFIMYMTDPAQKEEDVDAMRKALKDSKGPGNFRNVFMYAPNGKKDGIQIIPLAEVAAKDEFLNIKNITRDDVLAAHRVPPQLMGVIPSNTGGFGDANKAASVFYENEIKPLMMRLEEVNEWAGEKVIQFGPYALAMQT
ncbi:phage portal protein [Chromobacterium sphagni]|uniref:Phage portal protein n=1 Tax=Chromobacterium sphagni TaxID=1903179 RepID=A0A1S1WSU3_9NEIS|nr:phage portal protein [Chromobacterium sphagni]OHX10301.1 phage portal protein [Chromobacterium sphagni]OHX19712.1 phage portal protein [Chromobacterium sphagni]OHX20451.1 phage portal protein [Chromobacterium sphagni]